jgi:hypothetical protein
VSKRAEVAYLEDILELCSVGREDSALSDSELTAISSVLSIC